jgi:hypothetical protein
MSMRVKEMIVDGDRAFVRANYDYVFSNGKSINVMLRSYGK